MKKLIFLIVAICLIANYSKAQDAGSDSRELLQFGLKIGANYSNVYDAQGEELVADSKFGFAAGGFLSIPIGKYIGLQPELLFSQKGFSAKGKLLGSNYEITRTTNYIDIPILFALKPGPALTLFVGPQYSYLLKQNDVFEVGTTSIEQEQIFKNDDIRKNTLCFLTGLDLNQKNIVIGARVGWDVMNNNGDGVSTTPRYKNVWWQLTLGYRFEK